MSYEHMTTAALKSKAAELTLALARHNHPDTAAELAAIERIILMRQAELHCS